MLATQSTKTQDWGRKWTKHDEYPAEASCIAKVTRALVSLSTSDERDCVEARDIAQLHLDTVRGKQKELQNLERSLSKFVRACSDQCVGGPAPKCTILKDLSLRDPRPAKATSTGCCG